jgi:hypothetical protein
MFVARRLGISFALGLQLVSSSARACPCGSADPVMVQPLAVEAERPVLRFSGELRLMLDTYGAGAARADVVDLRLETSVQWLPTEWLVLSLLAPVVYREVTTANLARERITALADPELRVRARLLEGGTTEHGRHELWAAVGIDLPLMPDLLRPDGRPISMEAMVASGSADPLLNLLYRFDQGPLGMLLAVTWRFPTPGHQEMTMGPSMDVNLLLGGVLIEGLSLRGAAEARYELAAQMPGGPMPNTGGALVRIGGDLMWQPDPALSLGAGVRGPVIDAMNGDRDPGLTASAFVMGAVR